MIHIYGNAKSSYIQFHGDYCTALPMPVRKTWTEEEDRILRLFKEQRLQKKWSLIARKMDEQFGIKGRTGKQCRERYHNHLDCAILASEWTTEEDEKLFKLHEEVGNKWSLIAQHIPGRSDNCVKNHFYSRLRKSLRKLNKVIAEQFGKDYRQIKIDLLYKIIQIAEERFGSNSKVDELLAFQCLDIKNRLLRYGCEDPMQLMEVSRKLAEDISAFEQDVGKTNKGRKQHRTSTQTLCSRGQGKELKTSDEPFLQIFRRVCEQVMLDSN